MTTTLGTCPRVPSRSLRRLRIINNLVDPRGRRQRPRGRPRVYSNTTFATLFNFRSSSFISKKRSPEAWLASRSCFRRNWNQPACGIWHQGGFRCQQTHPLHWVSRLQSEITIYLTLIYLLDQLDRHSNIFVSYSCCFPSRFTSACDRVELPTHGTTSISSGSTTSHEPLQPLHEPLQRPQLAHFAKEKKKSTLFQPSNSAHSNFVFDELLRLNLRTDRHEI